MLGQNVDYILFMSEIMFFHIKSVVFQLIFKTCDFVIQVELIC